MRLGRLTDDVILFELVVFKKKINKKIVAGIKKNEFCTAWSPVLVKCCL